ncbi:MAG: (Fe-S)-binding protein, partial [Candidatus Hodarchaeota archaeon]
MDVSVLSEIQYDIEEEKKKVIPALRKMASTCTGCGKCLNNCVFHKYSKKTSRRIMKNIKDFVLSKKLDKKLYKITKKYIWNCGLCEHCNNWCPLPQKIPKTALIILLRGILNVKNEAPFIVKLIRRTIFRDVSNPILKLLFPIVAKILVPGWYTSKDPMLVKERKVISKARSYPKKGAEICFSGGCGHTWSAPNVVFGVTTILEQAGVDFITIGNTEFCCGVVYAGLGFIDLWMDQTYKVVQNYLKLKPRPKTIILHCPGCFIGYSFNLSKWGLTLPFNLLQKLDNPIEVKHVTEYILQLIKEDKIKLKHEIPLTVTYNDNCSVGRRMELIGEPLYDTPREILEKIPGIK